MAFTLAPAARESGFALHSFDSIPSTSAEALARAHDGATGPAWFVARHQTQGRGRRGARWQTAPGNLAATLLITTRLPPLTVAQLGFVAGLALARALDACCAIDLDAARHDGIGGRPPPPPLRQFPAKQGGGGAPSGADGTIRFALKWPNDVLADSAKLAGILLGTEEIAPGLRAVTVGIGVNVVEAPDGLPYPATSLRALGSRATAEELFTALSGAWPELAGIWDEGRGFAALRKLWLARAAGLGGDVAVAGAGGTIRGRFETIDAHGQLVVREPDGSARAISAGEVHFGTAATVRGVDA